MKTFILIITILATNICFASGSDELRGPSDLEVEAAIISELEVARDLTISNQTLSDVEKDLALAQVNALLEKAHEDIAEILLQRREIEAASGNRILVAVGLGFGGEATPLKVNFPKWIPAVGIGGDISVGLMTAFIRGPERLKFSGLVTKGFHASVMPKTGKLLSKQRSQTYLTIKLFFATPVLNPISHRYELINFNDLNRKFYGGGKDSGWNIKIPKTNVSVLKESTTVKFYGAWLDEEESAEDDVKISDSWWSRVGTYSLNLLESKSPDILMVSINIGVKKNDHVGNAYQIEMQKVRTVLDNNQSGSGFWQLLSNIF